jgi:hypothetical protein
MSLFAGQIGRHYTDRTKATRQCWEDFRVLFVHYDETLVLSRRKKIKRERLSEGSKVRYAGERE